MRDLPSDNIQIERKSKCNTCSAWIDTYCMYDFSKDANKNACDRYSYDYMAVQ
jgi:hypothetical protein